MNALDKLPERVCSFFPIRGRNLLPYRRVGTFTDLRSAREPRVVKRQLAGPVILC